MYGYTSQNTFVQCSDCLIVILQSCTNQSAKRTAVFFVDNHIVRYVNQTTGQVSGVGRLQSGIGKTLTSTVSRDKVLQHGKTFLKVRKNRVLDNLTAFGTCLLRFRHQTTHTGKLTNLLLRTTGSGIQHHVYGIESLIVARNSFHQNVWQLGVYMCPDINYLVVTLVVGNETHVIVVDYLLYFFVTFLHQRFFLFGNNNISQVERKTAFECHLITEVLDSIQEFGCFCHTTNLDYVTDDVTKWLLRDNRIDITRFGRYNFVYNNTTYRRVVHHLVYHITVFVNVLNDNADRCVNVALTFVVGNKRFFRTVESEAFTFSSFTQFGDIVQTEYHILCGHCDRRTVGWVQDIMWLEHQHLCFQNSFVAQRQVNGHLVTVEVGVECRTCQRVQLDCLAFNHLRLERLDTQTVQCRSTVQQYRMSFHYMFQNVPDNWFLTVYNLLGTLHRLHNTTLDELTDNERLVELGRHEFRNTALTHFQFRTYNDYGTCRVVDTLTQQVLTETSLLTFQTVGKWLQRTVGISLHCAWLTRVIEQWIDSFLQHTFLIT